LKKLFFITWALVFLYSVFVLLGAKITPFGRLFIYEDKDEKYYPGGLYEMCKIDEFRQTEADYEKSRPDRYEDSLSHSLYKIYDQRQNYADAPDDLDSSDILMFGDSFLAGIRGLKIFIDNGDSAGGLIAYNASADGIAAAGENPLECLARVNYQKSKRKFLILETVERYSLDRGLQYKDYQKIIDSRSVRKIVKHMFTNDHIAYLFTDNFVSYPFFRFINNIKFSYFKDIDTRIGGYSEDPKMLYYFQAVEFNQNPKAAADLDMMARNIKFLSDQLDSEYNIELIYVIVPNKYPIYSDFVEPDYIYDNFIPEINKRLIEKGVNVIDMYSSYMAYRKNDDSKLLYYPSDTHFSALGQDIFFKEIVRKITELNKISDD